MHADGRQFLEFVPWDGTLQRDRRELERIVVAPGVRELGADLRDVRGIAVPAVTQPCSPPYRGRTAAADVNGQARPLHRLRLEPYGREVEELAVELGMFLLEQHPQRGDDLVHSLATCLPIVVREPVLLFGPAEPDRDVETTVRQHVDRRDRAPQ